MIEQPYHGQADVEIKDLTKDLRLGATGKFPQGKISPSDEGELRMAVGDKEGKVFIAFGKSIEWLALDPQKAREFADLIRNRADRLLGR